MRYLIRKRTSLKEAFLGLAEWRYNLMLGREPRLKANYSRRLLRLGSHLQSPPRLLIMPIYLVQVSPSVDRKYQRKARLLPISMVDYAVIHIGLLPRSQFLFVGFVLQQLLQAPHSLVYGQTNRCYVAT